MFFALCGMLANKNQNANHNAQVTVEDREAASAMETHVPKHVWCALVREREL